MTAFQQSQQVVEVLHSNNAPLSCAQQVVEVLYDPGAVNMDCGQVVVEVLYSVASAPASDNSSSVLLML